MIAFSYKVRYHNNVPGSHPGQEKFIIDKEINTMTFRELLNVMPTDEATNVSLYYFDHDENMYAEDLYISWSEDIHKETAFFSLLLAEHFAEDEVIELSNRFSSVAVTVDRKVKRETVKRWKTEAADAAGLSKILRDWEDDE